MHRKLRDNPYMNKPAYRAIWIELLLEAEHGMKFIKGKWVKKEEKEMKSVIWKGKRIYLKPGQLTCGLKQLSKWTGVPRSSCKRVLDCFKTETMIETQTSNKFSLVTINNWEVHQQNETQNETVMRRQWDASETPVDPPKECKNDKNEEKEEKASTRGKLLSFGEEGSVKMTAEEYKKLCVKIGRVNVKKFIQGVENWKLSKGGKYLNDYRGILSWVARAKEDGKLVLSWEDFEEEDFENKADYEKTINRLTKKT